MSWPHNPVASPAVVLREESDDSRLLFDADTGEVIGVSPVGAAIWPLLDGTHDLEQLVAEVRASFSEVPDGVAADVAAFVEDAVGRGFARFGPTASPPAAPLPAAAGEQASSLMRSPRRVHLEITSRCNLRCRYCYYFDNPAVVYRDLSADEWLRFFDELGAGAVMEVVLAGGEPFVRADLPSLVDGIVRHRMRFSVLTNGTVVTDAVAAHLAETGRCDSVQVSIDGASAETHESARGRGSFAAAMQGIRTLQRHGLPVTARVTVHRRNVGDLEAIARVLLDDLALESFSTNAAAHIGSCRLHGDELQLGVGEHEAAMATLLGLAERYGGRITAAAGPLDHARRWRTMEAARAAAAPPFPDGGRLTACGCAFIELAVRADGVMVPCSMLAHLELGRINREPLAAVWRHSPVLARLRQRRDLPLERLDACAGCVYQSYCTGGCPGTAYGSTNEDDLPSPDSCLRRFLAAGGRLPP